jgi:hypothetical protein
VIGGTSAELTMKTVKMASIKALDNLPTEGNALGHAWRDLDWEAEILQITRDLGIGAQFGGKYYCHDVRVIRLPRHGASCPIGIGVSCSADRQAFAKITPEGLFIETLERDPAKFLPDLSDQPEDDVVAIDLNKPMSEILASLSAHPVETRLALTGPVDRGARHCPCQIAGTAGSRRQIARLFQKPSGLLCGASKDTRRHGIGVIWPNHGWPHGFLCSNFSGQWWINGDACQGQPVPHCSRLL